MKNMMKPMWIAKAAIIGVTVFGLVGGQASAASTPSVGQEMSVLLNGRKIAFPDEKPRVDSSSHVLIPVRFVSQALGAKVDAQGNNVIITQKDKDIRLQIGTTKASVNGKAIILDTKAIVINGRTLVPLRFVSEALGQKVEWDSVGRWVWIGSKDVPELDKAGVKKVEAAPFKPLFKESVDLFQNLQGKDFQQAALIRKDNLPVKLSSDVIYDVWLEKTKNNYLVKIRYSGKHFAIYYLVGDGIPRYRHSNDSNRVKNSDGSYTVTFELIDGYDDFFLHAKNWDLLKTSDVSYIGLTIDSELLPLIEKPFV